MFAIMPAASGQIVTRKKLPNPESYTHVSKRAISLIPPTPERGTHVMSLTTGLNVHRLLLALEGDETTGCLKVVSPTTLSRGALLLLRGRVVGALFGQRGSGEGLTGRPAYQEVLRQLSAPGNSFQSYQLPERLVSATTALFHGSLMRISGRLGQVNAYTAAVERLNNINSAGCILAVRENGVPLCAVYMYRGTTAGVVAGKDIAAPKNHDMVSQLLETAPDVDIILNAISMPDLAQIFAQGLSLSGIGLSHRPSSAA